jgi:hypothetical protein
MKTVRQIKELAKTRLEEAEILCVSGKYDGAFYLAGYSVELMLKAKVCEHFKIDNLFDKNGCAIQGIGDLRKVVETYDINLLLIFSGLEEKFRKAKIRNENLRNSYLFFTACTGKKEDWNEQVRYLSTNTKTKEIVESFIDLLNHPEGILKWIEQN